MVFRNQKKPTRVFVANELLSSIGARPRSLVPDTLQSLATV